DRLIAPQTQAQATLGWEQELELEQQQLRSFPAASAPVQQAPAPQIVQQQQQQLPPAQTVQQQPVTNITATPLSNSKAEQIRRARQDAELRTEEKIVEELEQDRIRAEEERAARLFGGKLQRTDSPAPQQPVVQPPAQPTVDRDLLREEIAAALRTEATVPQEPIEQKYFSALAGLPEVPSARNVRGKYTLGAAFGTKFDDAYSVEGSFLFSNLAVERMDSYVWDPVTGTYLPAEIDVRQYSGALGVKYFFLNGVVQPMVGGLAQYSYREYLWNSTGVAYSSGLAPNETANSHAIDIGLMAGAELNMNRRFGLGFEYRQMWNLNYNSTGGAAYRRPSYGTPLEKLGYYTLALSAKVNF
ncbi:MAG: porin family protein, partial [Bdellovibrionaceae bacterium]|nr:porin family protein [Pseudobdellovibrionaceae bacterium]